MFGLVCSIPEERWRIHNQRADLRENVLYTRLGLLIPWGLVTFIIIWSTLFLILVPREMAASS